MATLDKTRLRSAAKKKVRAVAAVELYYSDFNATDTLQVFKLPENCLITAAYTVVKTAANASSTLSIGSTPSGTDLATGVSLTATGGGGGAVITSEVDTGTGTSIYVTPNQALTAGRFYVIVEYIEYTRNNGELTSYNA